MQGKPNMNFDVDDNATVLQLGSIDLTCDLDQLKHYPQLATVVFDHWFNINYDFQILDHQPHQHRNVTSLCYHDSDFYKHADLFSRIFPRLATLILGFNTLSCAAIAYDELYPNLETITFVFRYIRDWTALEKHLKHVNCSHVIMIIMCDKRARFTYSQLTNGLRGNPNVKTIMLYFVDMDSSMLKATFTIDECDVTHAVDLVLANCSVINRHPKLNDMIWWLYLSWNCYLDTSIIGTYLVFNKIKLSKLANAKVTSGAFARYYNKSNNCPIKQN